MPKLKIYWFEQLVDVSFFGLERVQLFYSFFEKVHNIEEADFCFNPIPYECLFDANTTWLVERKIILERTEIIKQFENCINIAEKKGKKILILYYWDPETKLNFGNNSIVIRASVFKKDYLNQEQKRVVIFPAMHLDEVNVISETYLYQNASTVDWDTIPKIGFRGTVAEYTRLDILKNAINKLFNKEVLKVWWPNPYVLRRDVLDLLHKDGKSLVDFNSPVNLKATNKNLYKQDFINCLYNNPYSICVRGFGNFSFRLNETMAAGRIPIFINTNCALPFENEIPYRELCVWVEASELKYISETILEFHHKNKHQFVEIQKSIREYWLRYLSKEGFLDNLNLQLYKSLYQS